MARIEGKILTYLQRVTLFSQQAFISTFDSFQKPLRLIRAFLNHLRLARRILFYCRNVLSFQAHQKHGEKFYKQHGLFLTNSFLVLNSVLLYRDIRSLTGVLLIKVSWLLKTVFIILQTEFANMTFRLKSAHFNCRSLLRSALGHKKCLIAA